MAQEEPIKTLKLTRASDVVAVAIRWLLDLLIPLKTITVVSGNSGIGKTTIILMFLAKATRGTLPGLFHGNPRDVLIMSPEDDPGSVTRPRLEAAGADLSRVHFVSATRHSAEGAVDTGVSFPSDLPLLRQAIEATNPAVVMIDPIASLAEGNLDKREVVRGSFDPLAALANEFNLSIILIAHNKKGMDSTRGRISGSAAITDAARSVLALGKDDESGQIIMSVDKNSYSTSEGKNYAYTLESVEIQLANGETSTVARAEFVGETELSVAELNNRAFNEQGADEFEGTDAERWLLDYLERDNIGGMAATKEILNAAKADGFPDRTMQRAGSRLCEKVPGGFRGAWSWRLDPAKVATRTTKVAKVASASERGNLGNLVAEVATFTESEHTNSDLTELDPSQFQTPMLIGENT